MYLLEAWARWGQGVLGPGEPVKTHGTTPRLGETGSETLLTCPCCGVETSGPEKS